jgi:hypothetical protein
MGFIRKRPHDSDTWGRFFQRDRPVKLFNFRHFLTASVISTCQVPGASEISATNLPAQTKSRYFAAARKWLILEMLLVGARGFEPPTSRSRTVRSTRLSHAPNSVCDSSTAESRRQKAVGRKYRAGRSQKVTLESDAPCTHSWPLPFALCASPFACLKCRQIHHAAASTMTMPITKSNR